MMRNMVTHSQRRKYFVGILAALLVVSLGVNLYDRFIALPQAQATMNNMRVDALDAWLDKMQLVKNILKRAETNIDVEDAEVHASWAGLFVNIFENGMNSFESGKELYLGVSKANYYFTDALHTIYVGHFGNETGPITKRDLDETTLTMIENVTTTIENLESKVRTTLSSDGVEPAQQLTEAGILTDVLNLLEQIYQISIEIHNHYK